MPRLSIKERLEVIEMVKNGHSYSDCARKMKRSRPTICDLVKKHKKPGSVEDRPRLAKRRVFPACEDSWFECDDQKRPFVCTKCRKTFTGWPGLKHHINIHINEKQYQCDQCGKSFLLSSSLVQHARIHTGEKPYMCEFCARRFANKASLKTHIRTHTGERPHQCHLCEHKCSTAGNLHAHMKVHRDKDGNIPRALVPKNKSDSVPIFDGKMMKKVKRKYEKNSKKSWQSNTSESKSEGDKMEDTTSSISEPASSSKVVASEDMFTFRSNVGTSDETVPDGDQNTDTIQVKIEIDSESDEFQDKINIPKDECDKEDEVGTNCALGEVNEFDKLQTKINIPMVEYNEEDEVNTNVSVKVKIEENPSSDTNCALEEEKEEIDSENYESQDKINIPKDECDKEDEVGTNCVLGEVNEFDKLQTKINIPMVEYNEEDEVNTNFSVKVEIEENPSSDTNCALEEENEEIDSENDKTVRDGDQNTDVFQVKIEIDSESDESQQKKTIPKVECDQEEELNTNCALKEEFDSENDESQHTKNTSIVESDKKEVKTEKKN